MPYMSGTHLEAVFTWTDKSHKLVVDWPRGAPKPPILAVFEGASSPLDAVGGNEAGKVFCECLRERLGGHSDDDCSHAEGNADCLRTYKGDCERIIACNFGEPGVWPSRLSGYRNAGPGGWCMKECGRTQSCGAGEVCSDVWGEPKVCLEN